jgi:uroporphyrinogen-III synthase
VSAPELDGYAVGVTADRRAAEEIDRLLSFGASVLHGPTVRTLPLSHDDALRQATQTIVERPPEAVVAVTGLGMRAWLSAADVWGVGHSLADSLASARLVACGPAADRAIRGAGLAPAAKVDAAASSPTADIDEIVRVVLGAVRRDGRIAVEETHPSDIALANALRAAGAHVVPIPVYEWTLPDDTRPALRLIDAAVGGSLHAITFTSAPALQNLFLLAAEHDVDHQLRAALGGRVIAMCVGPVCTNAAERCGVRRIEMPSKYRIGPMIDDLGAILEARTRRFVFADHEVVLRGGVLELDHQRVELGDREAGLLEALTSSPGMLVSKRQLLTQVWGSRTSNDHVVEVTIARLRRRLGGCADAIVAVPRRGYRFEGITAA